MSGWFSLNNSLIQNNVTRGVEPVFFILWVCHGIISTYDGASPLSLNIFFDFSPTFLTSILASPPITVNLSILFIWKCSPLTWFGSVIEKEVWPFDFDLITSLNKPLLSENITSFFGKNDLIGI